MMKNMFFIRMLSTVFALVMLTAMLLTGASADYDESFIPSEWDWKMIEYARNGIKSADGLYEYYIKEDGTGLLVYECTKSRDVILPGEIDGVIITEILDYLYYYSHRDIRSVTIPNSVKRIPDYMFATIPLEMVAYSDDLEEIGDGAFLWCNLLKSLYIPASVNKIGMDNPFAGCSALEMVELDSNNQSFLLQDGCLFTCDMSKLISVFEYAVKPKMDIPEGVKEIGNYALAYIEGIENVVIASSVLCIGDYAFNQCSSLSELEFRNGVEIIGEGAFVGCDFMKKVVLPETLKQIGNEAFAFNANLQYVKLPESVVSIGEDVFHCCSDNLILIVPAGSYAEQYAIKNEIRYANEDIEDYLFVNEEIPQG